MNAAMKYACAAEDALEYLPCTVPLAFEKGETIYGGAQGSPGLYVVLQGRVKVWRAGDDGVAMILAIYSSEKIFGESAFLGGCADEFATAIERTQAMSWPVAAIEEQIAKAPRLGIALIQTVVARDVALTQRIRAMAVEKTPARVALALLALANDCGARAEDGALCFPALTHQSISEVVGTSREIVTAEMGKLRRLALVAYSRKEIRVYPEALREHLVTQARLAQAPRTRTAELMAS
jgi:CRP-like cAMP-binding protein